MVGCCANQTIIDCQPYPILVGTTGVHLLCSAPVQLAKSCKQPPRLVLIVCTQADGRHLQSRKVLLKAQSEQAFLPVMVDILDKLAAVRIQNRNLCLWCIVLIFHPRGGSGLPFPKLVSNGFMQLQIR